MQIRKKRISVDNNIYVHIISYGFVNRWLDENSGNEKRAIDDIRYYFTHVANGVSTAMQTDRI